MTHLFLKDKEIPSSVQHIMQELKVLLSQRQQVKAERHAMPNVTHMGAHQNQHRLESLIKQYQRLSGPVARYFLKSGDAITFRLYVEFKSELDEIKKLYETEKKESQKTSSLTRTTKIAKFADYQSEKKEMPVKKEEGEDGGESGGEGGGGRVGRITKRLKHLQDAVNELLDGHLDADAIDHLMRHGNLKQMELIQLLQYIQSKKAGLEQKSQKQESLTSAPGMGMSMGEGGGEGFDMAEGMQDMLGKEDAQVGDELLAQAKENRGKTAQSEKKAAFGRSYREKLDRLESKILRALNQHQFHPTLSR